MTRLPENELELETLVRERTDEIAQYLAAIVESSDDAIITNDLHGTITSWNKSAERIYGYAFAEAVGKSVAILIPPDRQGEERRILDRINRGERVEHYETLRQRKDGSVVEISLTVSPVRNAQGLIIGASKIGRDITERKRREIAQRESQERLEGLIRSTMDAVVTIDEDQRIVLFNPAAERMFACPAADATGSAIERFIPASVREVHRDHVRKFGKTGVTSRRMGALGELSAVRANGEVFPIEAAISQVTVGGQTLYTAIVRDITERKQVEEGQRVIVGELQHRTRNMLTVVQAIITNSMTESKTLAEAGLVLSGRVRALSNAYSLLIDAAWEGASLAKILSAQSILESNRVTVDDDCQVLLRPRAAQQFAMIVHELATNALKYGALSSPDGRISISCKIVRSNCGGSFIFSWKESGGPRVSPPTRKGFGSVILLDAAQQFGTATMDYLPDGLLYQLELDLKEIEALSEMANPP